MAFLGALLELIAEGRRNPARLPLALISSGVVLSAASLALIIFKAPAGIFLRLHGSVGGPGGAAPADGPGLVPTGSTSAYLYYGILGAIVVFGLAEASLGLWMVPCDGDGVVDGWHAVGKTVLWVSLLPLVLVFALGGLAFLK